MRFSFCLILFFLLAPFGHAHWTEYVSNPQLKFNREGGFSRIPVGYKNELAQGRVSHDYYDLRLEKNDKGQVVRVVEAFRLPKTPRSESEKSLDVFQLRNVTLTPEGKEISRSECAGVRSLSTFMGMLKALPGGLGNERAVVCRSVTPKMCQIYRGEMAKLGNHDVGRYAKACQDYVAEMSRVFSAVTSSVSEDFFDSETRMAGKDMEQMMKNSQGAKPLNFSTVNVSALIGKIPPQERIEKLQTGMLMFNEMIELDKLCPLPERPSSERKPQRPKTFTSGKAVR